MNLVPITKIYTVDNTRIYIINKTHYITLPLTQSLPDGYYYVGDIEAQVLTELKDYKID
jgi:hypothetical protein